MDFTSGSFVWNREKELLNVEKHGVTFAVAARVFKDPKRKVFVDSKHSEHEERFFCAGKAEGQILTVRFTARGGKIRIIGAGSWRKGREHYEKED